MCNISKVLKIIQFADDTTFYLSGDDIFQLCTSVTNELVQIDSYFRANRLSLNVNKTSFMVFSHKNTDFDLSIKIRNTNIDRVNCATFLGIKIDDKLRFVDHVTDLSLKLSRASGVIYRLSSFIPPLIIKQLYYSMFFSRLIYGITIWGNSSVANRNKINVINKRVEKTVRKSLNTINVSNCNLMSLDNLFRYFSLIKFFRCVNTRDHMYFTMKLDSLVPIHSHSTRFNSANFYNIPNYKKSLPQNFFLMQGIKFWNELPDNLMNINNIDLFKRELKRFIVAES